MKRLENLKYWAFGAAGDKNNHQFFINGAQYNNFLHFWLFRGGGGGRPLVAHK